VTADVIHLQVVLASGGESDNEAVAEGVLALGDELSELDVDEVEPVTAGDAPAGAKGIELLALGSLAVTLGHSSKVLREVVEAIRDWAHRTGTRNVKMTIDGDVLEIAGASTQDVKTLIDSWVKRHGEP
jgi:hypothetical protein